MVISTVMKENKVLRNSKQNGNSNKVLCWYILNLYL